VGRGRIIHTGRISYELMVGEAGEGKTMTRIVNPSQKKANDISFFAKAGRR
jgi:hypothetical protein